MVPHLDLQPSGIHLAARVDRLADVLELAATSLSELCRCDPATILDAFDDASETNFAIGAGIAVPHAAVAGLRERSVILVRAREAIAVGAIDGAPVDLFFVVAYPAGDPAGHLQFLAHLAALCRSRLFRDGLRTAASTGELLALVAAAEARLGRGMAATPAAARRSLAIISVAGERAADSIMVELLREELGSATILEAQTLQEAASHEVPLFAGFRDLFGDPGGRRLVLAQIDADRADALAAIVDHACADAGSASAELFVIPIAERWSWSPPAEPERGGH